MHPKGLHITTPTDTTIVLTRQFAAAPRLVWQAFTDPVVLRRWLLPPPGWTMTVCVVDARVGGTVQLAWRSADVDPEMTIYGVVTEVVQDVRLAHTEVMVMGSGEVVGTLLETHEFVARNGATTMRITQVYASKDARDGAIASGMEQGLEAGFQRIDRLLAPSV